MYPPETAASISDEKIHIFRLTFHLTIVILLFQVILEVNILPYYLYAAISSDLQVNIFLTIFILLFQVILEVNISPYYRYAAVSACSTHFS